MKAAVKVFAFDFRLLQDAPKINMPHRTVVKIVGDAVMVAFVMTLMVAAFAHLGLVVNSVSKVSIYSKQTNVL